MALSTAILDIQIALDGDRSLPDDKRLIKWVDTTLDTRAEEAVQNDTELTIRFVEQKEIQSLNATYRNKDKPTNVLSFPFEAPPGIDLPLLGDIVICPDVIEAEAKEQNKPLEHHYAHMVIHGVLHLLGYDHIEDEEAEEMERLEVEILTKLGIDDPYQDLQ